MRDLWLVGKINEQRGAVAVTVALMMFVLIGFAALSIDIGYLMVTRNELQNVADAAALAATRKLGNNYENMTPSEQLSYTCGSTEWPCTEITSVAIEAGLANRAGQVDEGGSAGVGFRVHLGGVGLAYRQQYGVVRVGYKGVATEFLSLFHQVDHCIACKHIAVIRQNTSVCRYQGR